MEDLTAPEFYNMAEDMDRFGGDPNRTALYWENEHGEKRTLTYRELRSLSNRFAHGLSSLGLRKGDKVILLLPRIPETYVIYIACLKKGLVLMPGSEMLMPKDILYRANHAEANAVICHSSLADRVEQILNEVPSLRHLVVVEGERAGWHSYEELIKDQPDHYCEFAH